MGEHLAQFSGSTAAAKITATFMLFCSSLNLTVLSVEVDNHGSTIWEAGWVKDGLNRYLTAAVTLEDPSASKFPRFAVEIYGGVDDGVKFWRKKMQVWEPKSIGDVALKLEDHEFLHTLLTTKVFVDAYGPADLRETYVVPRSDARRSGVKLGS